MLYLSIVVILKNFGHYGRSGDVTEECQSSNNKMACAQQEDYAWNILGCNMRIATRRMSINRMKSQSSVEKDIRDEIDKYQDAAAVALSTMTGKTDEVRKVW